MKFPLETFESILKLVAAPVMVATGVPVPFVQLVQHGILVAEAAARAWPGADKKALALSIVGTAQKTIETVLPAGKAENKVTLDPKVLGAAIDATIAAVNLAAPVVPH